MPTATYSAASGNLDRQLEDQRGDLAHGLRLRAAAHEQHTFERDAELSQRVEPEAEPAEHALDRSPGEVLAGGGSERHGGQARGGVGQVGGALALEVRHEFESAGAGFGGQGERAQPVVVHPEQARDHVEYPARR